MSNEKFTPGEWTVHEFYHEYSKQFLYNIFWSKDGEEVAERVYTKADAHLMAASKEMYRMLEQLHGALVAVPVLQVEIEKVLKKARGGQ